MTKALKKLHLTQNVKMDDPKVLCTAEVYGHTSASLWLCADGDTRIIKTSCSPTKRSASDISLTHCLAQSLLGTTGISAHMYCNNIDGACAFPLAPIFLLAVKCLQFHLLLKSICC